VRFDEKLKLLKRYEHAVFAACVHVLTDERRAILASKETLIDLFRDEAFPTASEEERTRKLRSAAAKQCIRLYSKERGFANANV